MKGLLLFDIDGVIRDVSCSYRLAIQKTVNHYTNWLPSIGNIDDLKKEGVWNNDWEASLELIERFTETSKAPIIKPSKNKLIKIFNDFYFGGDPEGNPKNWSGYIKNEPLLVSKELFDEITANNCSWGFISGAERSSAKFILEDRLGLEDPPLIAMGDAPEKPNPNGLIHLAEQIIGKKLGLKEEQVPIAYLGDTVADILTIEKAKELIPKQNFLSLGLAPPHLHSLGNKFKRDDYESSLKKAGADKILDSTLEIIDLARQWNI